MAYHFNQSSQYMTAPADVTGFPVTLACRVKVAANDADNGACLTISDKHDDYNRVQLYLFSNGFVSLTVRGVVDQFILNSATYPAGSWITIVGVVRSAISRSLYVNGVETTDTQDTGALAGIVETIIGARYNDAGTAYEAFFLGDIADVVVDDETGGWSPTQVDDYEAGGETHLITGLTPAFYRNLIHNTTAPDSAFADYGSLVTPVGAPTVIADHPALMTGQNTKYLTVTGTNQQVKDAMETFVYDPDPLYEGPDELTSYVEDDTALNDTALTAITVAAAPAPPAPAAPSQRSYRRRR